MIYPTTSSILPRAGVLVAFALALLAAIAWGSWQRSEAQAAGARLLKEAKEAAEIRETDLRAELAKFTRQVRAAEKVNADATKKLAQARDDAAAAGLAADGLRDYVAALEARAGAAHPGAAGDCQDAAEAARMLADLQRRADERAGILAAFADRAAIAGEACQRAYESLDTP